MQTPDIAAGGQRAAQAQPRVGLCFHCHDPLPSGKLPEHLRLADKSFCCEGCKMVYEILNTNDLCQYYDLDDRAGNSLRNQRDARAYAWLDDAEVAAKLLDYADSQRAKVTFYLPGMHCAACIWLLEHLYKLDEGVSRSLVNFPRRTVSIDFSPEKTSLRRIAAMLSSIGYPPEINLGDVENAQPRAVEKTLIYQIGLAGFAFGNIMLLSFPEYLGLEKAVAEGAWFFGIFGYLNLLLAIPVLVYSARDYLVSAWNGLKTRHLNIDVPLSLGIVMLFARSAFEILTGTGAGYMDSFAGLVFFLLCGKWFQQKTFHHLSFERDYRSYFPVAAAVRRGDSETPTPVNKLEPGDIIVVRHGELIPADGLLLKGRGEVDYSFVTGEAEPVAVQNGERVFAGGKQLGERIEISLTRRVSQSYLTQLWNDEAFKTPQKSHAAILADKAGKWFTGVILGVGSAAFLYWWLWRGDMGTAVNAFTAVFMVACPCAVALSIPFTMGNVLRILGRNRFYVKNTRVIEAFSAVTAAVFDKTGTLTNIAQQQIEFIGQPLSHAEKVAVRSLAWQSAHPLSRQIAASMPDVPVLEVADFRETAGKGIEGTVAGQRIRLGSASFVLRENSPERGVFLEIDGSIVGAFEAKGQYRTGLEKVVGWFRERYPVFLLSGDNDREAANLSAIFSGKDKLHFNQSPQDKLAFVKDLQQRGENVLMLGDGLNDAGALRQSDLGVVVTENTNNFTPACDAILHADEFSRLPKFIALGRAGMRLVDRAYLLAFSYNVVGLAFAVSGTLSPLVAAILMPLSSVTIVLFGTLGTNWAAHRLGVDDDNQSVG